MDTDKTWHDDDRPDRTDGFWHNDPPTDDQLYQMAAIAAGRVYPRRLTRSEAKAMQEGGE